LGLLKLLQPAIEHPNVNSKCPVNVYVFAHALIFCTSQCAHWLCMQTSPWHRIAP
jgi:hypothetical protein